MESDKNQSAQLNTLTLISLVILNGMLILTQKANQTFGFLHRNIKVKSKPIKYMANQTLVRLQLEYGSEIWLTHTQTHIYQIERVQTRAAC